MPYFLNENYSGYLPESEPTSYNTIKELRSAVNERIKDLKEWYEHSGVERNYWTKELTAKLIKENDLIDVIGIFEYATFQSTRWIFVYWNDNGE